MKTFKLLRILLVLAVTAPFISCHKEFEAPAPAVDFKWNTNNNQPPTTFSFINTSVNIANFLWDFGDHTPTSNVMHPSHTFNVKGEHTITLTGSDKDGKVIAVVKKV